MASIRSPDHLLPVSKRRLKPLSLRDYLLDDLSSCSSNGFKSFPRRQSSSTVCFLLDAEIKRSGMFRYNRSLTCGLIFTHAVQKASTVLLSAVKLLSYPSRKIDDKSKNAVFSRSFSRRLLSRSFWKKSSTSELSVDGEKGQKSEGNVKEIQRWKTFADFLQESQDQPSDRVSSGSGEATLSNPVCYSSIFSSESITNSEVTQSSSSVSETSNEKDATETINGVVMRSGDCVGSIASEGSTLNDKREECVNEEREQLSPLSILECPFEDDAIASPSHQNDEKKPIGKCRRFASLVQLVPVDLDKCIEQYYVERQDQSENRANHLLSLVRSRLIEEPNHLLASHNIDNLLLDFFKENENHETRDEVKLVKIVEEWVMRRQEEEEDMFMSWEMREKREIYVKEMKWDCINGDEREYVVEELGNIFVSFLIDELVLDLSL